MTPGRRSGTSTDTSAVMAADRLLSSAMRSNDEWLACPFIDVVLPWCMRFFSSTATFCCSMWYGFRQRIVMADMAKPWYLVTLENSVNSKSSFDFDLWAYIFVYFAFSVWHIKHPSPGKFISSGLDSPLQICGQRPALTPIAVLTRPMTVRLEDYIILIIFKKPLWTGWGSWIDYKQVFEFTADRAVTVTVLRLMCSVVKRYKIGMWLV